MKNKIKKLILVLAILAVTIFAYISKEGMIVSSLVLLTVLYLVFSKIMVEKGKKNLQVSMETVSADKQNQITVKLKNQGQMPILNISVKVHIKNIITGQKDSENWIVNIGPKGKKEIKFQIKDSLCGGILVELKEVEVKDTFGKMSEKIEEDLYDYVYVLPQVRELDITKEEQSHYDMESYKFSPNKKGNDSSETFGINTYQPGNNIKSIHWKLSGKMDDIVIRELGLPVDNKLMIIVDKGILQDEPFGKIEKSQATEFAVSLSYTFLRKNIPHNIGWYNWTKQKFVTFKIEDEEDLWSILPEFLTSPFTDKLRPVSEQFIEAQCDKNYSNFAVVSNRDVALERFLEYGKVNLYRPEQFKK